MGYSKDTTTYTIYSEDINLAMTIISWSIIWEAE